jgi:hypothetical protein
MPLSEIQPGPSTLRTEETQCKKPPSLRVHYHTAVILLSVKNTKMLPDGKGATLTAEDYELKIQGMSHFIFNNDDKLRRLRQYAQSEKDPLKRRHKN